MTNEINTEDANELFAWISELELALENLQRMVIDIFAADDSCSRRQLLECIISQRQLWAERPVDHLQKLIALTKETAKLSYALADNCQKFCAEDTAK
jgi:hypothetical protein